MKKMIAYCGGPCDTCAILLATREKDDAKKHKMRMEIAQQIKEHYGRDCKAKDVTDCDGCKTEGGRLFKWSSKCPVRKCAGKKGVETCAHCSKYACGKLEELLSKEPGGKAYLEKIRSRL
jgi:hypothetical protein